MRSATWSPRRAPAPTRRASPSPSTSGRPGARRATTSSTACSRRSPTWLDPDGERGGRVAPPGGGRGARPARGRGADGSGAADRRARARPRPLGRRLAAQRRACTRRRSTSARCSARARRLPGTDHPHLGDAHRRRHIRLPAHARRPRRRRRRGELPLAVRLRAAGAALPGRRSARAQRRRLREAAAARMGELCAITGGRALLLFTSFKNLRVAEAYLRADAAASRCWCRASARATCCWRRCASQIGSVLLATQSFWEGVDVPGEALSLVVIDKIPFAVPDDPLTAARIDRIRDEGGDPFGSYPAAARGAGAEAGVRPADPPPRRPRDRRRCSTGASRARATAPPCAASLPRRLPAHRIARRRRGVLGARAPRRRAPPPMHAARRPASP